MKSYQNGYYVTADVANNEDIENFYWLTCLNHLRFYIR